MKQKLTINDLETILDSQNKSLPHSKPIAQLYGLSAEVLIHLLGKYWVGDNVFGNKPLDEFLRSKPSSKLDRYKMTDRLVEVAEMLFNFQQIKGIENIIEKIKNDRVEPYFAELQSAKLIHLNDVEFYFNSPSNKKGLDYDAVILDQDKHIPCEFKCKIEDTNFSKNTISQVLKNARKQLPKQTSSIIFIKIPEQWTFQENVQELFLDSIKEFFRRTTRVFSIVYYWEEWEVLPSGQSLRMVRYNELLNPNSTSKLNKILKNKEINRSIPNWTYFSDLIKEKFGKTDLIYPKPTRAMTLINGFSWHSIINILPQVSKGNHVFYEIGVINGTRISFLIDNHNFIKFEVVDAKLKKFEVTTDKPFNKLGLDNFCYLRFQLTPSYNFTELAIYINNKLVARKSVQLNQLSILLPNITLGADLIGKRKTAFEVASIAMYEKSSSEINDNLTKYYNQEFDLKLNKI